MKILRLNMKTGEYEVDPDVIVINGYVYMAHIFAGHYYPMPDHFFNARVNVGQWNGMRLFKTVEK